MCTDLLIVSKTQDGEPLVVNGRSQEFDTALGYRLILRKKGVAVEVTQPLKDAPLTKPASIDLGFAKYDYMGVIMTTDRKPWIQISNCVFDGLNEAGLSVGGLNAPGSKYQEKSDAPDTKNVFVGFLADWLLSQYATCAEVKSAFATNQLRAVAETIGFTGSKGACEVQQLVKLHFAVHDAGGNSLVIEFIDGEAKVTDNPIGVLTNLPVFSWHLTNLGLYAHLSNFGTSDGVKFGNKSQKVEYAPPGSMSAEPITKAPQYRSTGIPGMGDGLAGIPGDFRPASRFIRTAYMKKFAVKPVTENEAVSQAFHLLNGVDIVKGANVDRDEETDEIRYDTAQIIMVKDLINQVFYLRM